MEDINQSSYCFGLHKIKVIDECQHSKGPWRVIWPLGLIFRLSTTMHYTRKKY